jgi:hypothetical protein
VVCRLDEDGQSELIARADKLFDTHLAALKTKKKEKG